MHRCAAASSGPLDHAHHLCNLNHGCLHGANVRYLSQVVCTAAGEDAIDLLAPPLATRVGPMRNPFGGHVGAAPGAEGCTARVPAGLLLAILGLLPTHFRKRVHIAGSEQSGGVIYSTLAVPMELSKLHLGSSQLVAVACPRHVGCCSGGTGTHCSHRRHSTLGVCSISLALFL